MCLCYEMMFKCYRQKAAILVIVIMIEGSSFLFMVIEQVNLKFCLISHHSSLQIAHLLNLFLNKAFLCEKS